MSSGRYWMRLACGRGVWRAVAVARCAVALLSPLLSAATSILVCKRLGGQSLDCLKTEGLSEDRLPLFFGKVLGPVALDLVALAAIAPVLHPFTRLPDHHTLGGEIFPGAVVAANPAGAFLDHHDDAAGRAPTMNAPLASVRGRRSVPALHPCRLESLPDLSIAPRCTPLPPPPTPHPSD